MEYFVCFVMPAIAICIIIALLIAHIRSPGRSEIERDIRADAWAESRKPPTQQQVLRLNRICNLEQHARKGDLIAFQEWKYLTGNHDVVDIGRMPDITFTGVMVEW